MSPATAAAKRAATAQALRPGPKRRAPASTPRSPHRSRPPARGRSRARAPMPARLVPIAVGRTAGAVSGIAESGLIHRLTRGRLWIGLLATLLVGIVAMNVLALSFNATASRTGLRTDVLKRQVSILRAQIAAAGVSNERVQSEAAKLGLIVPEPGSITYLTPSPDDAATAAKRLTSGELVTGAPEASTPAASTLSISADTAATTTTTTPAPASAAPTTATPAPAPAPSTPTPAAGTGAPAASAPESTPPVAAAPTAPTSSAGGGTSAGGGVATP
jgi:hypothetical protein